LVDENYRKDYVKNFPTGKSEDLWTSRRKMPNEVEFSAGKISGDDRYKLSELGKAGRKSGKHHESFCRKSVKIQFVIYKNRCMMTPAAGKNTC